MPQQAKKFQSTKSDRIRKSEQLTSAELADFNAWIEDQPTILDAAESLGVSRFTVPRIKANGSCHPDTLKKIRPVIKGYLKKISKRKAA